MWIELLNFLVTLMGILMSLGHFLQAYKIYKRKSAKDISLITYATFTIGSYVWLVYGIVMGAWPIIASYTISVIGTTIAMILIIKYR